MTTIESNGLTCELRLLIKSDKIGLQGFFESLSSETKSRYAPHPLTSEFAQNICINLPADTADRFILIYNEIIIGYFIIEYAIPDHELKRYLNYGKPLRSGQDVLLAPCILDPYQRKGLGSKALKSIFKFLKENGIKNVILLGGTQMTNIPGRALYEKMGFKICGGYQTNVYNYDMYLVL